MISDDTIQNLIDNKTKPLGALGQLEHLAFQICKVQGSLSPTLTQPHIFVFAADHGIADSGVSAYPKAVTAQMVLNFVQGGAAINVFSQQHQIALSVVDAGVDFDFDPDLPILHRKIAHGTQNMLETDAMSVEQYQHCVSEASQLVDEAHEKGSSLIGFGEMGIGNTSSAALIEHYLLKRPLEDCIGRGTGLDDDGLAKKRQILAKVTTLHGELSDPEDVLRRVGGFEIAMMSAAMLRAADRGMLIMVDGFIASAAALCAHQLNPAIQPNLVFCHRSEEPGHQAILSYFDAKPLLDLNMRLGEGSGCALAYPLLESAVRFINEMASFESANVSKSSDDA